MMVKAILFCAALYTPGIEILDRHPGAALIPLAGSGANHP
jgi:hypothetical protein